MHKIRAHIPVAFPLRQSHNTQSHSLLTQPIKIHTNDSNEVISGLKIEKAGIQREIYQTQNYICSLISHIKTDLKSEKQDLSNR